MLKSLCLLILAIAPLGFHSVVKASDLLHLSPLYSVVLSSNLLLI
jgi:hypothetical protein